MNIGEFVSQNLVHVAAVFTLLCFLFRDQIKLRVFAAIGDFLLSIYYVVAFPEPLWNPMVWSLMNVVINVSMILLILRDGREGVMSDDELSLFRSLDALTPGQFRKLVKLGHWHRAEADTVLTRDGEMLDKLYYVLDSKVSVMKLRKKPLNVGPKLFIGELAFLRKRPATATTSVPAGALYMSWPHADLEALFQKDEDLKTAMHLLMGRDVAEKMAKS
jgi:Popeye protein conserved region